jgi:hypothetical protein
VGADEGELHLAHEGVQVEHAPVAAALAERRVASLGGEAVVAQRRHRRYTYQSLRLR